MFSLFFIPITAITIISTPTILCDVTIPNSKSSQLAKLKPSRAAAASQKMMITTVFFCLCVYAVTGTPLAQSLASTHAEHSSSFSDP